MSGLFSLVIELLQVGLQGGAVAEGLERWTGDRVV